MCPWNSTPNETLQGSLDHTQAWSEWFAIDSVDTKPLCIHCRIQTTNRKSNRKPNRNRSRKSNRKPIENRSYRLVHYTLRWRPLGNISLCIRNVEHDAFSKYAEWIHWIKWKTEWTMVPKERYLQVSHNVQLRTCANFTYLAPGCSF